MLDFIVFFFNDTATTEIYTLSLHDALPISSPYAVALAALGFVPLNEDPAEVVVGVARAGGPRSRELIEGFSLANALRAGLTSGEIGRHTSELQSRQYLVCRLLLEKKKKSSIKFTL